MTAADLTALKDYILTENTYFSTGYAHAFKDAETNKLFARGAKDLICVFPADTKGSYFYLRSEGDFRFTVNDREKLTDSGKERVTFLDTLTIQCVAVVRDADEYTLISNLRSTAMAYTGMYVVPTAANYNREDVVRTELRGLKEDDIRAALQRLKNEAIVRVTFTVAKHFTASCIVDPCKNC